ncbi:endospore germination permease [Siminovitchia sediminis]|uniref:Endospore germination permease n=1 Tax=Siminovitchia sediminis TaxID=1274353 RepID=A0ABW4KD49_9BACI
MLTKWETLFLIIMTLPIMGHVVILPLIIDVAGRDAWISVLLSLPAAFAFAFAIYRLRLNHPDLNISEMLYLLLGKWFGRIVSILFIIYFLFLTILSFSSLVDVVFIDFLPETPQIATAIWFLLFFIYAATKGIKRIALTAGVLTFIGLVTGHTVTLMDTPKKDWSELQPLLEFGWSPALWGSLILLSIWVELLLLLCVPIKDTREKRLFLLWVIGILLNALMMNSTTTGVITIFGLGQADNFTYPAQEIVRTINLGFIDRFDIYGMILMTFGTYIRCSLYFRIAYDMSISQSSSKWMRRIVFTALIVLTFFSTLYISKEHFRLEEAINVYTYMIVLFPIPFLLFFISQVKKKRDKQNIA